MIVALNEEPTLDYSFVHKASSLDTSAECLQSRFTRLNDFLAGGLPWGQLIEWGMPWGLGGRELLLSFLQAEPHLQQPYWCLWAYHRRHIYVYPPAWAARGIALQTTRFARCEHPLQDLKPALRGNFFRIIVLDGYQYPQLQQDDYRFLAQQARQQKTLVIVLRDHFLSTKKGNVWAKLRLNSWRDPIHQQHFVKVIKGLSPRQIGFSEKEFRNETYTAVSRHNEL